jgi:hypothetical protein
MKSTARFFIVPQHESLYHNWGSKGRRKASDWSYDSVKGRVTFLPTVKEAFEAMGEPMEAGFTDSMHMTRRMTKKLHVWYWAHVEELFKKAGTWQADLPIVIWEFNADTAHLKNEADRYHQFWNSVVDWGAALPDAKEEHADKINQLINGKTPLIEWYKSSRKHVTHWIANNKKMKLDETDLDASDEYPITWCPGAMPGDVRVLSGIACCVSEAKIRAEDEEWPTDQEEAKWKHILLKFMKEVYPELAAETAWERLRMIKGRYRLAFAGLLGKHGANPLRFTNV